MREADDESASVTVCTEDAGTDDEYAPKGRLYSWLQIIMKAVRTALFRIDSSPHQLCRGRRKDKKSYNKKCLQQIS